MAEFMSAGSSELFASGFAVLRTPLLPIETIAAWSSNLQTSVALAGGSVGDSDEHLEHAATSDRQQLVARLRDLLSDDVVAQAVFIASSGMANILATWLQRPDYERGCKAVPTLASYLLRMATRPTPFGLFAGGNTMQLGSATSLQLGPRGQYRTHTRLDMSYLGTLCEGLGREASLRDALVYRPNPGLYRIAGQLRLAERRTDADGGGHTYHLVSIEASAPLAATLDRAKGGSRLIELAEALCRDYPGNGCDQAIAYLDELVDSQILLSDLEPNVTGADTLTDIIGTLKQIQAPAVFLRPLEQVRTALEHLDTVGLGVTAARYAAIADTLAELPAPAASRHLFHVDLHKSAKQCSVGPAVIKAVRDGILLLRRLSPPSPRQDLRTFVADFASRYQGRELPLMTALDEEAGIGFAKAPPEQSHISPLLAGLGLSRPAETLTPWREREAYLFRKLTSTLRAGEGVMRLDEADIRELQTPEAPELPDALSANVTLLASSPDDIDRGDFRLLWHGAFGPSGALYLGRFCHGDSSLRARVEAHLAREEALRPDAIFAELVHRPQDMLGNVICRPCLRAYEIPYLGRSGLDTDRQIPVNDLTVRISNGRIVLRSKRFNREVIPRLTTAHNAPLAELGVYRFLCALATQGVAYWLGWSWGALESAVFLPRVEAGRLVLARARWRLDAAQLARLEGMTGAKLLRRVHELRENLKLPRWVQISQGDRLLPLDLENVICAELLASTARGQAGMDLSELYPAPEDCCVTGPEGHYVHELVIPFEQASRTRAASMTDSCDAAVPFVARMFTPGDEWLFAKLYTGPAGADQLLREVITPFVASGLDTGNIDRWFFLRYADPESHLRLRMHGQPCILQKVVWPELQRRLQPFVASEVIWRITLDTYDREIERYGGGVGIELAEAVFQGDSQAALELLALSKQDSDLRIWQLALLSVHRLLDDLGIDLQARIRQLGAMCSGLKAEFQTENPIDRELSRKYRELRDQIEPVLHGTRESMDSFLTTATAILDRRSAQLVPIRLDLAQASGAGRLARAREELAQSFAHMTVNRLLCSAARAQELVLYEFLLRHYRSVAARSPAASA